MSEPGIENIAVVMTCHNRREKTLRCLEKLEEQEGLPDITLAVYLTDDGSADGTSAAVRETYPDVNLLEGDGTLFWTRGMHKAMAAAMAEGFDCYLWLNDDVTLYDNALAIMLATYRKQREQHGLGMVAGSLCDPETGEWTYGASQKTYSWYPLRFTPLKPSGSIQEADNFWGNVVLIPHEIAADLGNLDPRFLHGAGDHDYALRAKKKGYRIWIPGQYVGECARNSTENTWEDSRLSLKERYRKMFDRKAMDLKTRYYYTKKHGGLFFPLTFLFPYLKLPFVHILDKFKKSLS